MNWLRAFVPVAAAMAFAWLVSGVGSLGAKPPLQLIQVSDMAPRDVEVGDRLTFLGTGFPAGKPARVTFRGTLYRPGEPAQTGAEVSLWGAALGPDRAEVAFGEATQALFCGSGDKTKHTTFEGDVEVAFSAAFPGTPPIAGLLQGVTLDVRPNVASGRSDRDEEGERVLAFLGLRVANGERGVGLRVDAVARGSRASASGIVVGDVLTTFGGVRVASPADVVPAPGSSEIAVRLRHASSADETRCTVSVAGLRRAPPVELLGAAFFIVAAIAAVLLFCVPAPQAVASVLARCASRARVRLAFSGRSRNATRAALSLAMSSIASDVLPPAELPAFVDAASLAALAVMPFGQYVVAAKVDVGLLFAAAAAALAAAALVASESPWRGVRAGLHVAFQHVPAAASVACVVLMTGTLRVQEIERAQGGWPSDWLAFRSPAAMVAFCLFLSAGCIDPTPGPSSSLAGLVDDPPAPRRVLRPWLHAACRAQRVVIAGLASVLFLGGWALPGLAQALEDAHPAFELLGAAWLLGKTACLVVLLALARWASQPAPLAERSLRTLVTLVPVAAASLGGSAAWLAWGPAPAAQLLVSGVLVVAAGSIAAAGVQRLHFGLVSPSSDGRLSPFL